MVSRIQRADHDVSVLAARARITLLQPSFGLGDFTNVDRLLAEGERMGGAALSLCMGAVGA